MDRTFILINIFNFHKEISWFSKFYVKVKFLEDFQMCNSTYRKQAKISFLCVHFLFIFKRKELKFQIYHFCYLIIIRVNGYYTKKKNHFRLKILLKYNFQTSTSIIKFTIYTCTSTFNKNTNKKLFQIKIRI